jgi:putative endonuclease
MKKKSKPSKSPKSSFTLGKEAEEQAFQYFTAQENIEVLARNYRTPYGEIDLICYDRSESLVIFVEVKSGCGGNFTLCQDAINAKKREKIAKVARNFLENLNRNYGHARFDAVFIERDEPYRIEHVRNIIMLT